MTDVAGKSVQEALRERFPDGDMLKAGDVDHELLVSMAKRGSCRTFSDQPVPEALIELLCAAALSAPTKSDLQQRDIVMLRSAEARDELARLVSGQEWVADAPVILVFCGNNRRQRLLHEWHDIPFANDHLDALFNAVADAAIALGAFVTAAEAVGLGCCPISAVRNEAQAVSDLIDLPDHVFPFAGLAVGYPKSPSDISMRLPLRATCHVDKYQEGDLRKVVDQYDAVRRQHCTYEKQRFSDKFGEKEDYGWSDDKARQYSAPERADFGQFIRGKGFTLE